MGLQAQIQTGGGTAGLATVDAGNNLMVTLPNDPLYTGQVIAATQVDDGAITGTAETRPIDIDGDFKTRIGGETHLESCTFGYGSQDSGKHGYTTTTMTLGWSAAGLTTNASSITTINTGCQLKSYAMHPVHGAATLYLEFLGSFSSQPVTNTTISAGMVLAAAATPFTPLDGAYFYLNSSGLFCAINFNGTVTSVGPIAFNNIDGSASYTTGKKYDFIIQITERQCEFWVENIRVAVIKVPTNQGRCFMAAALQFSLSHAIGGTAASGVIQFNLNSYTVTLGGPIPGDTLATIGNRILAPYSGLGGGTMGSLANYANSANPTAAVPTNTTAALGTGLGGQFWETATLALNTDGIIWSYQVPAGSVSVQGRRLLLKGIYLMSYIQTIIAGGPFCSQYSLAFGHTSVSLATSEGALTKAPRRVALPAFTQLVTATQAVSTLVSQPGGCFVDFGDAGIVVNPGEFVALVTKHVGTVGTSGTIAHISQPVYGWL